MGVDMAMTRYVTGAIADDSMSFTQLFKHALQTPIVMSYIQDYPDLIEKLPLIFDQPFNASMHAAGVIIVPESEYGIFDQLPVKKVDGVIISEWEMGYIEQAGFLKMDLLGLKQLDKFSDILTLIKEFRNVDVDLVEVPLDDIKVYDTFAKGQNEDVFQFGGHGLKGYTQDLKPENINDLIATVALYRPGPIETQAHMQYVDRKNGREMPQFPFGTENILQETYGNIVYQEQVIKIVQVVGGFTMNEADDVRKAMGKKDAVLMAQYKQKFVDGAMLNGAPMQEASNLWDQMEVFAQYAFNKSHATCYAITGYHCQWLKVNYPLEFWTVSLRKSTDDQIPARLSEMYATSSITVAPPDINKSGHTYKSDPKLNIIYWTITSIKQVGKAAIDAILEEREKNGPFYSVTEFAKRLKPYGSAVKKNTIINLIVTGAFDEVAGVTDATERFNILQEYHDYRGLSIADELLPMKQWKEYKWILQQRALSGLGYIDFSKIIRQTILSPKHKNYITNRTLLDTEPEQLPSEAIVGGVIVGFNTKGANYRPFALVDLSDGNTIISVVIWNNTYESYKGLFKDAPVGKLCLVNGAVKYDNKYKKQNALNTVDNKSQIVIFQEN
jgi:DNA polymerase-3 subunit alpha